MSKAQIVPSPAFPMFVAVAFAVGMICTLYLLKTKMIFAIGISVALAVLFILISNFIDGKYGYLLRHYYQRTPYMNLLNLTDYSKQKGNYITVLNKLKEKGYRVDYLTEGSTDRYNWKTVNEEQSYTKRVYFVNDDFYIIFDWDQQDIANMAKKDKIENLLIEKTGEKNIINIRFDKSLYIQKGNGQTALYNIIPDTNNNFDFILM